MTGLLGYFMCLCVLPLVCKMYLGPLILFIVAIEVVLLGVTLEILTNSLAFEDVFGQIFALYVIVIAGAESAIGLGILISYYRLKGNINVVPRKKILYQ